MQIKFMKTEYITNKLWDKVEKSETKIAKKVYDCMNKDIFSVLLNRDVFYFERTWSGAIIPNYVYKYAITFYKKLGFTYLYDLGRVIHR